MVWFKIWEAPIPRDSFVNTEIQMEGFYTNAIVIDEYTNFDIQQWGALHYQDTGVEIVGVNTFAHTQLLYNKSTLWRPDRIGLGSGTLWLYVSRGCPYPVPLVQIWSP